MLSGPDDGISHPDYSDLHGFDFSPMTIFAPHQFNLNRHFQPKNPLSERFDIVTFSSGEEVSGEWNVSVTAKRDGELHYLLRWLVLQFPDGTFLENGPGEKSCRSLSAGKYLEPKSVNAGDKLQFHVSSTGEKIMVSLKGS